MEGTRSGPAGSDIFLSYSRADSDFRDRLAAALEIRGFRVIFDQADQSHRDPDLRLSASDEWWKQLQVMIAASAAMIFVVSPDSVNSPVCDDELAFARQAGKRVIPLLRRAVDFAKVPARLRSLNVKLNFERDDDALFAASVIALCNELEVDIEWHRRGARLSRLAQQWELDNQPEGQLLRSGAIAEAEAWMAQRPAGAPAFSPQLLSFLHAGRTKEVEDRRRLLRITGSSFVLPVEAAVAEERYDHALRLAAASVMLSEDFDSSLVPERVAAVARASRAQRLIGIFPSSGPPLSRVAVNSDGTRIVTVCWGAVARIWDVETGKETAVLAGHGNWLTCGGFSPDGARVLTASGAQYGENIQDNTARVWDITTGQQLLIFEGHKSRVHDANFSPDGTRIVTASRDRTVRLWDARSAHHIAVFGPFERMTSAFFSDDGARIVAVSVDRTTRMWDASSGRAMSVLHGHTDEIAQAVLTRDGTRIVTASADRTARIWDAMRAQELARLPHDGKVASVSVNRSGTRVVTTSNATAHLWNAETGEAICDLRGHTRSLNDAFFSPCDQRIATISTDGTARIWDATGGSLICVLAGHDEAVNSAAFFPDGRRIVTASGDGTARVWDTRSDDLIAVLMGHDAGVTTAAFDRGGGRVVTGARDRTVRIWDIASGSQRAQLEGHSGQIRRVAISPDGSWLVSTAIEDNSARVWNMHSARLVASLGGHRGHVACFAFSSDGRCLVTGDYEVARIWDIPAGSVRMTLRGHKLWVTSVSYSPDETRILTVSNDLTARIWDVASGAEVLTFRGHANVIAAGTFSPDAARVMTYSHYDPLRVWDAKTGAERFVLKTLQGGVVDAAFSPSGDLIVTASSKIGVIWDAFDGTRVLELQGHEKAITRALFTADGLAVITASEDGSIRLWDAESGRPVAVLGGLNGSVGEIALSADGRALAGCSEDHTARVWDITRYKGLCGAFAEVLAASLSNGRGVRSEAESKHILMQSVPHDLAAALMLHLDAEDPSIRPRVAARAEMLVQPLHANCYLAPSGRVSKPPPLLEGEVPATD